MGVTKLFAWIEKNYRSAVQSTLPPNVDALYLDFNAIVHNIAQQVYGYGSGKGKFTYRDKVIQSNQLDKLHQQLLDGIVDNISTTVERIRPRQLLMIAFDGPAPLAKIAQQRTRRYVADDPFEDPLHFTSAAFSPGTLLMEEIGNYIQDYIKRKRRLFPKEVIFSSVHVPGEGEHKIADMIRERKFRVNVILGMDNDLIIIGMRLGNTFVLREMTETTVSVVDCDTLATLIKRDMRTTDINNFILISFVVGNDFLYALPEFEDILIALPRMIKLYAVVATAHKNFTLVRDGRVVWENLLRYFSEVVKYEKIFYVSSETRLDEITNPILEAIVVQTQRGLSFDINILEELYYRHIFRIYNPYAADEEIPKLDVEGAVHSYLTTMNWILRYYNGLTINRMWQYNYHYTPMLRSIVQALSSPQNSWYEQSERQTPNFTPLEHLASIMPSRLLFLLPQEVRDIVLEELPDLYPITFKSDQIGRSAEHKSSRLIPFVQWQRVKNVFQDIILSSTSQQLNRIERNITF